MSYIKSSDIGRQAKSLSKVQTLEATSKGVDVALMARWRKLLDQMKTPRLLLRIMLCASLVLNGLSPAAATVHMQGMTMGTKSGDLAAVTSNHTSEPSCHERMRSADGHAATSHAPHAGIVLADQHEKTELAALDCCKSGKCQCACIYYCPMMASVALWHVTIWKSVAVRSMAIAHASPTFPKLIRPPIG